MVRILLGLFIVFGAVGTLDADPSASILVALLCAAVGFGISYSGIVSQRSKNWQ